MRVVRVIERLSRDNLCVFKELCGGSELERMVRLEVRGWEKLVFL